MGYPNPFLKGIPTRGDFAQGRPDGPPALAELIGRFLESQESDHTRRAFQNDLTGFFDREFFGREASLDDVREVGAAGARRYLREEAEEYAFETVRRRAVSLRAFFVWLVEEGLVEEDPLAEAPGPAPLAKQAKKRAEGEVAVPEGTVSEGTGPTAESANGEDLDDREEASPVEQKRKSEGGEEPSEGGPLGNEGSEEDETEGQQTEGQEAEGGEASVTDGGLDPANPDGVTPDEVTLGPDLPPILPGTGFGEEKPPEELFPEGFLEVPHWAKTDLKVQIGSVLRFTGKALEEGMEIQLQSLPSAIAKGLSLLADRERFPEGAIRKPYYMLAGPSGEWMVTVWRTGADTEADGKEEGGSLRDEGRGALSKIFRSGYIPTGLAARLTFANPLVEAETRMEEEGTFPSPSGEAARLLWLMQERGWVLTGPSYDLLEAAIGLPSGRKDPAEGRGPAKRFGPAGLEETREEVALEVATLLAKGLGLSKSEEVLVERTTG